ncbi:MAG: hypothetical protein IJZ85_13450 [Lachnospiraceae bacterium]|nr:hypothetical protein [Lachnospiraceae bacterium]
MSNFISNTLSKIPKDKDSVFKYVIFGLYLALHFALCFFHEPWRDESQAYLIVRDLSIPDIYRQLTIEGHPFLWYLAMLIPVKLGLPVHFLSFVSFVLSAVGTWFFIFKAPFKTYVKALILPGMLFTYSLPIIARDYCLVALLLPIIGYLYDKRYQKPFLYGLLIFLLPQIHVIMAGFGIMLAVVSLMETLIYKDNRSKLTNYIPFICGLIGTLTLIMQLKAGSSLIDLNAGNLDEFLLGILSDIPLMVKNLLKACMEAIKYFWEIFNGTLLKFGLFILLLGILMNLILIKHYWRELLIVLGGVGAHVFIHAYIWKYIPQRTICTVFIFLIYVWMIHSYKEPQFKHEKLVLLEKVFKKYLVALIVFLSVVSYQLSFNSVKQDFTGNYSGGEETAEFILNELPEDAIVVSAAKDYYITPVIAHYDYTLDKVWNPSTLDYEHTFVDWNDRGFYVDQFDAFIQLIKDNFSESDNIYILDAEGYPLLNPQWDRYELVFSQMDDPCVWGETYAIYKFNWDY